MGRNDTGTFLEDADVATVTEVYALPELPKELVVQEQGQLAADEGTQIR
jgi:hypothetical protein